MGFKQWWARNEQDINELIACCVQIIIVLSMPAFVIGTILAAIAVVLLATLYIGNAIFGV